MSEGHTSFATVVKGGVTAYKTLPTLVERNNTESCDTDGAITQPTLPITTHAAGPVCMRPCQPRPRCACLPVSPRTSLTLCRRVTPSSGAPSSMAR